MLSTTSTLELVEKCIHGYLREVVHKAIRKFVRKFSFWLEREVQGQGLFLTHLRN